jgi:23S rRNA (cytosine1962-C5)-methyltransferase
VTPFKDLLALALDRRSPPPDSNAFRAFSGQSDGLDGVFIDVYASGAVLIEYQGRVPQSFNASDAAHTALHLLSPRGVRAIYHKPFMRDRSKIGGELPPVVTQPEPLAGAPLEDSLLIQEGPATLEVRLFDGLSTGIFLDQRANRAALRSMILHKAEKLQRQLSVLNTFAYTCAFSVFAALAGASTASVDVSTRYLDWGKRNFTHNDLDPSLHRFARMGTFEFLEYAQRKALHFDLVILDPPSFASGSKKNDVRPWSSVSDYAKLVAAAARVLHPGGAIFASTNTQELCLPHRLEREIIKGLGKEPRWLKLPPPPIDFARERDRFAAVMFAP